jgi:hypothetical protein
MVPAITALSILLSMGLKIYDALKTGNSTPVDLQTEISRLQASILKPSSDIIAEADAAMGKPKGG